MRGVAELQALLRLSNQRALSRLISRVVGEFPLELGEGNSKEYWKDSKLQDVRFPILLDKEEYPGQLLCRILAAGWSVARPWTMFSVGELFMSGWEFVAIATGMLT
ncbi:hypothetical protein [Streptomyces sp. NPDC006012]|uniref:hypothetical protein n=1 Tax=Streptomyces sp. NPDC006012 TaxID=3364739 RepID=UPI0036C1894A